MQLIDVKLLEGVFPEPERERLAAGLLNAVAYEGGVKAVPDAVGK